MQTLSLKIKGLYTYPNNLGDSIPDGALEKATNITIDAENIGEVRRGFSRLGGPYSTSTDRASKYFVYQNQLLSSYTGNKLAYYRDTSLIAANLVVDSVVMNVASNTAVSTTNLLYGPGIPAHTNVVSSNTTAIVMNNAATIVGTNIVSVASGWVDYTGAHEPISTTFKIQSAEANQNFYYTTTNGVQKLSAYTDSTSVDAGMPRGLDIVGTPSAITGGFLADNSAVAYRVVWGLKDANNNVILGAPSNRNVVVNPDTEDADNSQVSLVINIPSTITISHFVQIYRSKGTATDSITPSENMQLIYENNPTSGEISALSMTVVDNLPYSQMGAFLYTSPSEEGIAQANEVPPHSKTIASFKDSMFYGNTTAKHRLNITMVGTGHDTTADTGSESTALTDIGTADATTAWIGCLIQQSNGTSSSIASNTMISAHVSATAVTLDTATTTDFVDNLEVVITPNVTIAGVTYIPRSVETAASDAFKVYVTGTPSQDISNTAQSLVRVINATTSQENVYAYYISSVNDLSGQILIEERDLGGDAYTAITPIFGTEWSPVLPTTGTSVQSTSERQKNGIYFSKYQEPEAVPLVNNFRIGSAAKEILREVPVRDSLFVLKEDGIWRILGQDAKDFRVEVVDLSTILIGPETASELNNQLFCLSNQGVVIVTETGVSIISNPIEGDLLDLFGSSRSLLDSTSFAIGYKTDRSYLLFIVSGSSDAAPTQCYRYNTIHQNWARWDIGPEAGILNPADDKLYISDNSSAYSLKERKTYDNTDHVDEEGQINITAASGTSVTVSDASDFNVEDILYQTSTRFSRITAVDTNNNMLTVELDYTTNVVAYEAGSTTIANSDWAVDSAVRFAYIPITIQWMPNSADNPGILKLYKEVTTFVTNIDFTRFDLCFKTELDNTFEAVTLTGSDLILWGLFGWGEGEWPGSETQQGTFRTYTPINKARGSLLTIKLTANIAYRSFGIQGISVPFENGNEWVRK